MLKIKILNNFEKFTDFSINNYVLFTMQLVTNDQESIDYMKQMSSSLSDKGIDDSTHFGYWLGCKDEDEEGNWICENSDNYWISQDDKQGIWGTYVINPIYV